MRMNAQSATADFEFEVVNNCDSVFVNYTNTSFGDTVSFDWTFTGGVPGSSDLSNPLQVYYTTPGNYQTTLDAYMPDGSFVSSIQNIVIPNHGNPFILPEDTIKCDNENLSLGVQALTGYTLTWSPANMVSNPDILNPLFQNATAQWFYVEIADNYGPCVYEDSVFIDVYEPINLDLTFQQWICEGDSVLTDAAVDVPLTSIVWSPDTFIEDANTLNTLVYPPNSAFYQLNVVDENGCQAKGSLFIEVDTSLQASAGPDQFICPGNSVELSGSGGSDYLWSPAPAFNDPNEIDQIVSPDSSSVYVLTVSSPTCTDTDTVEVFINAPPNPEIISNYTICPGDSVQVNYNGFANPLWTYEWSPSAGISDSTISNPYIAVDTDQSFQLIITDENDCADTSFVNVSISGALQTSIDGDNEICEGDTIQLLASGGTDFSWFPLDGISDPNISNPLFFPEESTTYSVISSSGTCTDSVSFTINVNPLPEANAGEDFAVCLGDEVQLTGTGGVSYLWEPSTGLSNAGISSPFFSNTETISYTLTVTSADNCTASDDITVTVNNPPGLDFTPSSPSTCQGEAINVAMIGAVSYSWSPSDGLVIDTGAIVEAGPLETTTYTVTGTDVNGCSSEIDVTIEVIDFIDIQIPSDTIYTCLNADKSIVVSGADNFFWSPSLFLNSVSGDSIVVNMNIIDTITYTLTGSDLVGCSETTQITVISQNNPVVFAGLDDSICPGEAYPLLASGSTFYTWSPSDLFDNPNISNPLVFPESDQLYIVTGTNEAGCRDEDSIFISILPEPEPTLNNLIINKCEEDPVQMLAQGGIMYEWSPGFALSDSLVENPISTTNIPITYTVDITNVEGCMITDSITILIDECFQNIKDIIPNVLTLNGDNKNDIWVLEHPFFVDYPDLSVQIWNRWGELLYEGRGNDQTWDGRHNDKVLSHGTYYYALKLNSTEPVITGTILLIN